MPCCCTVVCVQLRTDGYNEPAYTFTISKKMTMLCLFFLFCCFTLFPYWMTVITLLCHSRFSLVSFRDPGWMMMMMKFITYFSCLGNKNWRDRDRHNLWHSYRSAPLFHQSERLFVRRDNFFQNKKRNKIFFYVFFLFFFLHLVLSLNGFYSIMTTTSTTTCAVCHFLVEKAETRWWWVGSCVPFCACCSSLSNSAFESTPAGQSRVNL